MTRTERMENVARKVWAIFELELLFQVVNVLRDPHFTEAHSFELALYFHQ